MAEGYGDIRRSGAGAGGTTDSSSGVTVEKGTYEAIVVSHVNGSRSGQLKVYVKDWKGRADDPASHITVKYASPFFGTTYGTDTNTQSAKSPMTAGQSYGMWMIPPDVGNTVLVTFVAGDKDRGYWFACAYDTASHHMVPGNARNVGGNADSLVGPDIQQYQTSDQNLPAVEAYPGDGEYFAPDGITGTSRFPHEFQAMTLIMQGLDRDKIRGAISSTSLREAPSNVYGISTPGPSATSAPQVTGYALGQDPSQATVARKGGHTFVMDDGALDGVDQLIRLRTSSGHQILMNDTEKVLYIASSTGNQWLEFSEDGSINVFGAAGINMRSKGPLNLHSDSQVSIHSGGTIALNGEMGVNITALTSVSIQSLVSTKIATDGILNLSAIGMASVSAGGALNLSAVGAVKLDAAGIVSLNGTFPSPPVPVVPNMGNSLPDVTWGGSQWQYNPGAVQSICSKAPSHEPWIDPGTGKRPTAATGGGGLTGTLIGAATSIGGGAASRLF
jgi:hypothetical protein